MGEMDVGTAKRELISFKTGDQEFCLDIQQVREIRGYTPATHMPHAPEFVRGVINLRGTVMPVLDLGARFGFGTTEPTDRHVIIVAQVGDQQMGLLVDAVCETLNVAPDAIQPSPDIAGENSTRVFKGFLPIEGRMVTLVDLTHVAPEARLVQAETA
jgi:purine-binding chemotaxis protein CheW